MSYNPACDMPATIAEWNQLVDFYLQKENAEALPGEEATRKEIERRFACYYPAPAPAPETAPTLAELKAQKKAELDAAFYTACQRATVTTTWGWPADANETAYRNVQGLLITMENTGADEVQFCDAENNFHAMNQKELEALQQLIISHGQALYQRKWELREEINQAETEPELSAITISFP